MVGNFLGILSLGLMLLKGSVAQRTFTYDIPPEESAALEAIIEDDPSDVFRLFKDWESPEYNLIYRNPLPIPPVKQPLKLV